jgi:hypothetical protein
MNRANPLWGAPRIHGELLKLGFEGASPAGLGDFDRALPSTIKPLETKRFRAFRAVFPSTFGFFPRMADKPLI